MEDGGGRNKKPRRQKKRVAVIAAGRLVGFWLFGTSTVGVDQQIAEIRRVAAGECLGSFHPDHDPWCPRSFPPGLLLHTS